MSAASQAPLFLLAIDHRRSFERLLGIDGPIDEAIHARLAAAKVTAVEALAGLVAERSELTGAGVLLDDDYGSASIESARTSGLVVAVAFERSGQALLEFEHADWEERLRGLAATRGLAKLLIRHRADGAAADRTTQLDRLRRFSDACAAAGVEFLLELLTPFTDAERAGHDTDALESVVRPRLITEAIAEIQAAGVEATVWKVEGVSDPAGCWAIVAAAQVGGRDDVGVVVLGAGAEPDVVAGWLRAAAAGGYRGFAVGRSIWAGALRALHAGEIDDVMARRQIATNYVAMVDTFERAVPA